VIGYYKSKAIRGPESDRTVETVEDVELATLGWVYWHSTTRLHGYLDGIPPTEFEARFYATNQTDRAMVEIQ
jgi:putative transposase